MNRLELEKTNVEKELNHQKILYEQLEQKHQLIVADKKKGNSGILYLC